MLQAPLFTFFVIKNFEEKEVEFFTELFQQKLRLCITKLAVSRINRI